jgi:hypothetical protein
MNPKVRVIVSYEGRWIRRRKLKWYLDDRHICTTGDMSNNDVQVIKSMLQEFTNVGVYFGKNGHIPPNKD